MTQPEWAERLGRSIAKEVRRYRKQRKMSAQQLAQRCAEIGLPIQRSVLANFENGRRTTIGVHELLVIARALKIPPVFLLYPVGYEESIEGLPGIARQPHEWVDWFDGEVAFDEEEDEILDHHPSDLIGYHRLEVNELLELRAELRSKLAEKASEEVAHGDARRLLAQAEEEMTVIASKAVTLVHRLKEASPSEERMRIQQEAIQLHELQALASEQLSAAREYHYRMERLNQDIEVLHDRIEKEKNTLLSTRKSLRNAGLHAPALPESLAALDVSNSTDD